MRKTFFKYLHKKMKEDVDIVALTGDLGYGGFDNIKADFPDRFINCGASEQAMMGIAVGLALSGKKVFVYSITPFLIFRAFETIRNYLSNERIPVCLIGSGRDKDYEIDGFSHDASDIKKILENLPGLSQFYPEDDEHMINCVDYFLKNRLSMFISLRR
jgi:transketolase